MISKISKICLLCATLILSLYAHANTANSFDNSFYQFLMDVRENSIKNRDWSHTDWDKYIQEQSQFMPIKDQEAFNISVITALINLNDHHSFLMNDEISKEIGERTGHPSNTVRVENGIGIINIPGNIQDVFHSTEEMLNEKVVAEFHEKLEAIKYQVTKGWIIDLSENDGGNFYPMFGSLSDFFTNQNVGGYYVYSHNAPPLKIKLNFDGMNFQYDGGPPDESDTNISFSKQYPIGTVTLPTIVIISNKTGSSGELLALALERQPNITLIGQPSFGIATCNALITLPNNLGRYMLAVGNDLDKDDNPLLSEKVTPAITVDSIQDALNVAKEIIESKTNNYNH